MHGDEAMANNLRTPARGNVPWRTIGWGGAVALLIAPFIAMQFTPEMNWDAEDFVFVAVVLATLGGLAELAVRASPRWDYRAGFLLALVCACLVIWVNVAVGIVGSDDNPNNASFFWALGVAVVGAAISRLRAAGMSLTMLATAIALIAALFIAQAGPTDEPWVPAMREAIGTSFFALIFLASAGLFRRAARAG